MEYPKILRAVAERQSEGTVIVRHNVVNSDHDFSVRTEN
jgi:hypothetical protein